MRLHRQLFLAILFGVMILCSVGVVILKNNPAISHRNSPDLERIIGTSPSGWKLVDVAANTANDKIKSYDRSLRRRIVILKASWFPL